MQQGTKLRAGRGKPGRNKTEYSEIGELKQKIRLLQRELAKVRMDDRRVREVNPHGRAVKSVGALNSKPGMVRRVSSTSTTLSSTPRSLPQLRAKVLEPKPSVPVRPSQEDRQLGPRKSALYRNVQVTSNVSGRNAPSVPIVTGGLFATSGTSPTAIGVMGSQTSNCGVQTESKPTGRFLANHDTGAKGCRDDDPEVVKPVKGINEKPISTMKNRGDPLHRVRRPQRVAPHYADCDLVHLLRLEYAFKPRTAGMLSQMAAKAKIYLAKYDCTSLTAKDQYNLVISAVSAAMEISPLEEQVRQSLRNPEGNMARHKQARMIREGILGNKLFRSPDKLPSNK